MRRNILLATGMLFALLAATACGAATDPGVLPPATATAGTMAESGTSDRPTADVGASQLAAAERARAAAARKAEEEAKRKAAEEAAMKAEQEAARKAAEVAADKAPTDPAAPKGAPAAVEGPAAQRPAEPPQELPARG